MRSGGAGAAGAQFGGLGGAAGIVALGGVGGATTGGGAGNSAGVGTAPLGGAAGAAGALPIAGQAGERGVCAPGSTVVGPLEDASGDVASDDLAHLEAYLGPEHLDLRIEFHDVAPGRGRLFQVTVVRAPHASDDCHRADEWLIGGADEPVLYVASPEHMWGTGMRTMLDPCRYLSASQDGRSLRILLPRDRFGFEGPLYVAHTGINVDRVPDPEGHWMEVATVDELPGLGEAVCDAHLETVSTSEESYRVVEVGTWSACGITTAGAVRCTEGLQPEPTEPVISLAAYFDGACALRDDRTISCWGNGVSKATPAGQFVALSTMGVGQGWALRQDAAIVGWDLEGTIEPVLMPGPYIAVTEACGLRRDGAIDCWDFDQRSVRRALAGPFIDLSGTPYLLCGVRSDRTLECSSWGTPFLPFAGPFAQVKVGGNEGCGLLDDGELVCFGSGFGFRHMIPLGLTSVTEPVYGACGLLADGRAACWPALALP